MRRGEHADRDAADDEARADEPRAIEQMAAERTGDDAEEQNEAADDARDMGRLAACALEERRHPVAEHHREAERRAVHHAERYEAAVERPQGELPGRPGVVGGCERDEDEPDRGDETRRRERRTPARPEGDERERQPARRHRDGAVEALRDRRRERCPHVVGAADERRGEPDAGEEAQRDRVPRLAQAETCQGGEADDHEPRRPDRAGAEAVAEPPAGICIPACESTSAVVKRPTTKSETP